MRTVCGVLAGGAALLISGAGAAQATAPGKARPTLQPDGPRPAPDLRRLFGPGGALSPGYQAAHARSTAKPLDSHDQEGRVPVIAVLFNPALAPVGKWSGRLEIAPLRAHALFVEVSRVNFTVNDTHVIGSEIDVGYHLFVFGEGLRGVYLGPRYIKAQGETSVSTGSASGWGGDIGMQWIVGPIAFNLGGGAAWVTGVLEPKASLLNDPSIPPEVLRQIPQRTEASRVVPLITVGLGLAL